MTAAQMRSPSGHQGLVGPFHLRKRAADPGQAWCQACLLRMLSC